MEPMRLCPLLLALASCSTGSAGICNEMHPEAPLTDGQPAGGLCVTNANCAASECHSPRFQGGVTPHNFCAQTCSATTPCPVGTICIASGAVSACVRVCANAGECLSVSAHEFCELSGDDAGTRVCIPHTCNADADCEPGFECQSPYCTWCSKNASCAVGFAPALCRRK